MCGRSGGGVLGLILPARGWRCKPESGRTKKERGRVSRILFETRPLPGGKKFRIPRFNELLGAVRASQGKIKGRNSGANRPANVGQGSP